MCCPAYGWVYMLLEPMCLLLSPEYVSPYACVYVRHMRVALLSKSFPHLLRSLRCLRNIITSHTWRASWSSHKVRMKYENDYGDLRLYYHDFFIIASLIYFCLLSFSLSLFCISNVPPMARAEVEQKGKCLKQAHALIHMHIHAPIQGWCHFLMPMPEAFCTSWQKRHPFQSGCCYIKTASSQGMAAIQKHRSSLHTL